MQDIDIRKWDDVKKQFLNDYQFKISGSVAFRWEVLKQKPTVKDFFSRVNEQVFSEPAKSFLSASGDQMKTHDTINLKM
jgi:hypothetical protein